MPVSSGDRIICLRLQVYMMNYYCGPISAGNLWVSLDKWEVAAVKTREYDTLLGKKNMSPTIFFCRDQRRMHETVMTSLYNPTHPAPPIPPPLLLAHASRLYFTVKTGAK